MISLEVALQILLYESGNNTASPLVIFMRKHSSDKTSVLSSAYFPQFHPKSSQYNSLPTNASFHAPARSQLIEKEEPNTLFRVKRNSRILADDLGRPGLNQQIKRAKEELEAIKKELRHQRSHTEAVNERKINKIFSLIKESTSQRFSPAQPVFYPVPMPMPVPYPLQPPSSPENHFSKQAKYDSNFHTSSHIRNRFKDREFRSKRARINMRKWRKAGNAVLFVLYLRRFCREFQAARKATFSKSLKKLKTVANAVRQSLRGSMHALFKLLRANEDVRFQIQSGERRSVQREKAASVKNVVRLMLQSLLGLVESSPSEITEYCYFLCKHGSLACSEPLLTEEQLELACVSGAWKCLSAERNLEKASIISLLVVDSLLANTLLSPSSLSQSSSIENNLFFVCSVVYELAIQVQDEYLIKVPKSYRIGNYGDFQFVQFRESIVLGGAERRAGELISGMKHEQEIKQCISFKEWGQEKKLMAAVVKTVWQSMRSLHRELAAKHF